MAAKIGSLHIDVGIDTARFQTGTKDMQKSLGGLSGAISKIGPLLAGAFAGSAIIDIGKQFLDMSRAAVESVGGLGEVASAVGVTTDTLQEYRFIATQVGLSNQEMDGSLAQLTRRLGDAAQGVKEPAKALERLGISLQQVAGKDAGDVIPLIADGMAKIADPAQRAAIAVDLFGKSGQKLMPILEGGGAGIQKMVDAAREMGIVLTPEEIANADKYGDAMAALDAKVDAKLAAKLSRNAEGLYQFELGVAETKLALVDGAVAIGNFFGGLSDWQAKAAADANKNGTTIQAGLRQIGEAIGDAADWFGALPGRAIGAMKQLYTGVKTWLQDKLGAVFEWVSGKIQWVADKFRWLDDVVVRNSYVPDMVDSIGEHMRRLQAEMVDPATWATDKTAGAFAKLGNDVQGIFDRLFPQAARARQFAEEMAKIAKVADPVQRALLEGGLKREQAGVATEGRDPVPIDLDVEEWSKPLEGIGATIEGLTVRIAGLGDQAKVTAVRVVDSFKDMADKTLGAFSRLADSIKGGGFLGILEAVIGLGTQLGSIGLFGKSVAARINAPQIPGYANGTSFHPGGIALVGERGPELVNLPRGSRVTPNHALGRRGDTYHFTGNLMTPEFWKMIQDNDERAARAGSVLAQMQLANSRRWSLV